MSEDDELVETDLFEPEEKPDTSAPLADRVRPRTLEEFAGQRHIIGEGALLRRMVEQDRLVSLLFWGPPGTGKTTLAFVLARMLNARFVTMSAVTSGVKDVKACIERAAAEKRRASAPPATPSGHAHQPRSERKHLLPPPDETAPAHPRGSWCTRGQYAGRR